VPTVHCYTRILISLVTSACPFLGEIPWIYKPEQESTCKYWANLKSALLEYVSHLTVWMGESKAGIRIS